MKTFSLPANSHPQGITAGPDGNLWFVDQKQGDPVGGFKIGKITTAGRITEYNTGIDTGVYQAETNRPAQITTGPDGNLWFTNPQAAGIVGNFIGKITTAGAVTIYGARGFPVAITAGPDGNLWVLEQRAVAKITTSGVETRYPLSGSGWNSITTGPDGNIWFTETHTIGYVTPAGVVTELNRSQFTNFFYVNGITSGPDGAVWFLGWLTGNIGRVTTDGQLTNTYALNKGSSPTWATTGPDGAVWFTQAYADHVSRITTSGAVTSFPTAPGANPGGIVTGPDGNLWFVEEGTFNVARMTTSGFITEYPVGQTFPGLWTIVNGPDGNLWFTEYAATYNNIVRITPDGIMTAFPIPTANSSTIYITTGPDSNLWFTENATNKVGKIDPNTGQITEYEIPGDYRGLSALVVGPDENLWIMENTLFGAIAKFSTAGTLLAEYPVQFSTLLGIKVGPDGALWFPQLYPNNVGRITTSGVVSTVPLTAPNAQGNDLVVGADGKLWVTEISAGGIARMSAIGGTGNSIHTSRHSPVKGAVATFVDGTPTATQHDFSTSIDWGDGVRDSGHVSGPTGGPFTVSGTHDYRAAGTYTVTVTLHDRIDNATYEASPGTAQVH